MSVSKFTIPYILPKLELQNVKKVYGDTQPCIYDLLATRDEKYAHFIWFHKICFFGDKFQKTEQIDKSRNLVEILNTIWSVI